MKLVEEKPWTYKTANTLTNEQGSVERWTVFLILFTFNRVLWIHAFSSVFYFSGQSYFSCYKNSKVDKSGVVLSKQGSSCLKDSVFLGFSLQLPQDTSLLFSYNHSCKHSSILFCT